ncbi:MAG: flagellar FliL protein, partial [Bermanella sp.]
MATEKELQLDAVEEPKSKKKLIIIIVVAVLVIAIGVAAALFLMGGDDTAEEGTTEEAVAEEEAAPTAGPAIYIKLKPEFIVNYQVGPRQRYLQIYMEAMTRNPAIAEAL